LEHNRDGGFLEESSGENLENGEEGVVEIETPFSDGNQGVGSHGSPDLDFDRVVGGAKEAFDAQMLLDPFERRIYIVPTRLRISKS
jgi:hypothetical protein